MFKRFCLILSLAIGVLMLAVLPALSESVDTAWVRRYNGPGNVMDKAKAVGVDRNGNVYVTGQSHGGIVTRRDYATIKYYPNGDTAWVRRYNGSADSTDEACAIAVDSSGNVYVTGYSVNPSTSYDWATIKYYSNGDTAWVRRYDGPSHLVDAPHALTVDDSGYVYVTGHSYGSGTYYDYATIKYYPNGDTAWVRTYNGPGDGLDWANAIAIDDSGNVCVTGISYGDGLSIDYATIKYYANGDTAWARRYDGPGNGGDLAYAMAIDGYGNIYVTGESYGGIGTREDYATAKYYPNGDTAWVRRYNGSADSTDEACAIAVDSSGNVYVTGSGYSSQTSYDYVTIKYYPNGDSAWTRRYDGPGKGTDRAHAIAVDASGNVYVTGSRGTIKYAFYGRQSWIGYWGDEDIIVDSSGNVYVTGNSTIDLVYSDYITTKYVQAISYVSIIDFAFLPQADTITVGDSVRWTNNGAVPHTSTSDTKSSWDSGTLNPGESFTFQFDGSGLFPYHCTFHPSMAGTIVVEPPSAVRDETGDREKPSAFVLSQNYPNPFNQTTKIEFTLAKSGFVSLDIYDILGRKVRSLISEKVSSGHKSVLWDGKNDSGKDVASGIYFYQLKVENPAPGEVGDFTEIKKLVLLK